MTKNFISFVLIIFAIIVVAGLVSAFLVIEYGDYTRQTEVSLLPQKTVEILDSYEVVTPLVPGSNLGIHNKIYVVHDNDRNVTCYLYDDGISCILDWFFEVDK